MIPPNEAALRDALERLGDEDRASLAAAIGKPQADSIWFDEIEVVTKAKAWVAERINQISPELPRGLLALQSALRVVMAGGNEK